MNCSTLGIGLAGLGTVGSGVVLALERNAGLISDRTGGSVKLEIAKVLVRRHLLDAGFPSADLADYLAALVLDFGQRDRARKVAAHDDDPRDYLVDVLAELERSVGTRRFEATAHLGNYALWLAGLYPDRVAARARRRGGPDLAYYDTLGRRGFALAGAHDLALRAGLAGVYTTAADRFPALRATLNRLSDRVFFPAVGSADRVLRDLGRGGD